MLSPHRDRGSLMSLMEVVEVVVVVATSSFADVTEDRGEEGSDLRNRIVRLEAWWSGYLFTNKT